MDDSIPSASDDQPQSASPRLFEVRQLTTTPFSDDFTFEGYTKKKALVLEEEKAPDKNKPLTVGSEGPSSRNIYVETAPFYSHQSGYKLKLRLKFYPPPHNDVGVFFYLMRGEYDDELPWPAEVTVTLKLLNQVGDHHHVERTKNMNWAKDKRDTTVDIVLNLIKYPLLEREGDTVQYMMDDCLKFRLNITTTTNSSDICIS